MESIIFNVTTVALEAAALAVIIICIIIQIMMTACTVAYRATCDVT